VTTAPPSGSTGRIRRQQTAFRRGDGAAASEFLVVAFPVDKAMTNARTRLKNMSKKRA